MEKEIKTSSEINVHNMSRIQLWPAAKIAPPRKKRERKKVLPPTCSLTSIRVIYNNIGDDFITLPTHSFSFNNPPSLSLSLSPSLPRTVYLGTPLALSHFETIHLALWESFENACAPMKPMSIFTSRWLELLLSLRFYVNVWSHRLFFKYMP